MEEQLCYDAVTDPQGSCDAAAAEVTLNWPDWPDLTEHWFPAVLTQRAGITTLTENYRELRTLSGNKGWGRQLIWLCLKWPLWAVPVITEAVTAPKHNTGMAAFHILRTQNISIELPAQTEVWTTLKPDGNLNKTHHLLSAWSAQHTNQQASVDWTGPYYHVSSSFELHSSWNQSGLHNKTKNRLSF